MQAWQQNDHSKFNFFDAHDINNLKGGSSEQTIKNKLRERLNNTKVFILLVGSQTKYHYKFVKWEIEQAMSLNLPIIVVNLNGTRSIDNNNCPPVLRSELALHISFNAKVLEKSLLEWESAHYTEKRAGKTGDYYFPASVYQGLGL
jgi:hypothetical protein